MRELLGKKRHRVLVPLTLATKIRHCCPASSRPMRLEGIVLRRNFGVLTVSVWAKKGLVTKKVRQAFSSVL